MLNISSRQPRACPLSVPSGPSASLDDERPLTIRPMRAPGGNYNDLIVRPNDSPRRRPRRRVPSSLGASPIASRLRAAASSVDESLSYLLGWIGAATRTPVSRSTACSVCRPDAWSRPSSWRSSPRGRSGSSNPRSTRLALALAVERVGSSASAWDADLGHIRNRGDV